MKTNLINLLLIISIMSFSSSQAYNNTVCKDKLYDESEILKNIEFEEICDTLNNHPNFIVRLQNNYKGLVQNNVLLESSSIKFFKSKCKEFVNMCEQGFLIDLYIDDKFVILDPGSVVKNTVKDAYRTRVIETIRLDLIESRFKSAITKAIILLDYKAKGNKTVVNQKQSKEPIYFLIFILIPIILFIFGIITYALYYLSNGTLNEDLYYFMDSILLYWNIIDKSKDKKIELQCCFFCFKSSDNLFNFMYCHHKYHEMCLRRWKLEEEKCCPCSYIPKIEDADKESELKDYQKIAYITIPDLKILLALCLNAYRKDNLYEYFIHNETKISGFNYQYDESLEELTWLYQNKLNQFKDYRVFYKMFKAFKMMSFILAFYPSFLSSKRGKLVKKILNIRAKGATVRGFS